jgi:hypothetical protein
MKSNRNAVHTQYLCAPDTGTQVPTAPLNGHANGQPSFNRTTAETQRPPKPQVLKVLSDNIPAELTQHNNWVLSRLTWKPAKSKWDKPPLTDADTPASSTDPRTWISFDAAKRAYERRNFDCLGFVLHSDLQIVAIDLDGCRNPETGEIELEAQTIIDRFASYTEVSPSGAGVRIFVFGVLPCNGRKVKAPWKRADEKAEIEAASNAKYMTVTGHHIEGTPRELQGGQVAIAWMFSKYFEKPKTTPSSAPPSLDLDDNAILEKAMNAKNSAKFMALWNGDTGAYPSPSEAESAFCCHLAFWTRDAAQIERLWLASRLKRGKAERIDYRERTIKHALETVTDHYDPARRFDGMMNRAAQIVNVAVDAAQPAYETFTFKSMADLPRSLWLIRGLLLEKISSVLSADSGNFKSFIALDMALCIATGREFFGREVKQGAVVYVAAEGFYTLLDRATAWAQHHECELPENFHILKVPINLADAVTVQKFSQHIEGIAPAFVVLDTLSQCAIGANENANEQMADFIRGMMAVCDKIGAHVQVLHHNAKSTGTFRGAGSIKANVDAHISLDRPEGDEENIIFVRCEKQRGRPFEAFALRGHEVTLPHEDEYGDPITSLVFDVCGDEVAAKIAKHPSSKRADKTRDALMEIFDRVAIESIEYGGVKVGFWKEAVENTKPAVCSTATFWAYRKKLEKDGLIEQCGSHKNSVLFQRPSLTPSTPSTPNWSSKSSPNSKSEEYSKYSNNPLGVGVLGVPPSEGPICTDTLPEMPEPEVKNKQADSEAYKPTPAREKVRL